MCSSLARNEKYFLFAKVKVRPKDFLWGYFLAQVVVFSKFFFHRSPLQFLAEAFCEDRDGPQSFFGTMRFTEKTLKIQKKKFSEIFLENVFHKIFRFLTFSVFDS